MDLHPKKIEDFEGYWIYPDGRVFSERSERFLTATLSRKDYLQVNLRQNGATRKKRIHRLVAEAFIPNPENKFQVDHIDNDKTNNNVSNLQWVTATEHSKLTKGRMTPEQRANSYKVSDEARKNSVKSRTDWTVRKWIRKDGETFEGITKDLCTKYGLDKRNIQTVARGKRKRAYGWELA